MENIEQAPRTQVVQKHYLLRVTPVSKALAMALFVALPFVGFWIGLHCGGSSIVTPLPVETTQKSTGVTSAMDTEGVATTTATGYIVSVDANKIVVDYVNVLFGEEAIEKSKVDGFGDAIENSVPLYDRNVNPQLRTFVVAPNVKILTDREVKMTLEEFSKSSYLAFQTQGRYYGALFEITLNDKNEIVAINGIFRP